MNRIMEHALSEEELYAEVRKREYDLQILEEMLERRVVHLGAASLSDYIARTSYIQEKSDEIEIQLSLEKGFDLVAKRNKFRRLLDVVVREAKKKVPA